MCIYRIGFRVPSPHVTFYDFWLPNQIITSAACLLTFTLRRRFKGMTFVTAHVCVWWKMWRINHKRRRIYMRSCIIFPHSHRQRSKQTFSFGGFKSFQETVEILHPPAVVHTHIGRNIARGSGVLESDSRSPRLCCCCACCRQAGGTLTKNIYIPRGKQTVLIDDCCNHIFLMREHKL